MKQKSIIIIVVLAVVLGGLWLVLQNADIKPRRNTGATLSAGDKLLPDLPVNDVAKISITQGDETATLVRGENEWTVEERGGYPANFLAVSQFLTKIWGLKIAQKATVATDGFDQLNLAEGDAAGEPPIVVAFSGQEDKQLGRLIIGKVHMAGASAASQFPNGRFVAVGENPEAAFVVADTLDRAEADPLTWLNTGFVRLDNILSISVDRPGDDQDWTVSRESTDGDLQLPNLAAGETFDEAKRNQLTNLFSNLSFDDVQPRADVEEEEMFANATEATIITADGLTYTVRVGDATEEGNLPFHIAVTLDEDAVPPAPEAEAETTEENTDSEETADDEENTEQPSPLEAARELLATQQRFESWIYFVPEFGVNPLLQGRDDLLEQPEEPADNAQSQVGMPGMPDIPGQVVIPNADGTFTAPAGQPIGIPINVPEGVQPQIEMTPGPGAIDTNSESENPE